MNKSKIKLICVIVFVLLIIQGVGIYLAVKFSNNNNHNNGNNEKNKNKFSEITRISDEKYYYSFQDIINRFYNNLYDGKSIIYLNEDYIKNNNINISNIKNILGDNSDEFTYVIKNIYETNNDHVTYYFINGYLIKSLFEEQEYYDKDINYLIEVVNNKYDIIPINNDINNYMNNFNKIDKDINSSNTLNIINLNLENKLMFYINNFMNLLFFDTNEAFNMLESEKYSSIYALNGNKEEIYNKLSSKIFSYNEKYKDNMTIYTIINNKEESIIIKEKQYMDYMISFN